MKFKPVPHIEDHIKYFKYIEVEKDTECWIWKASSQIRIDSKNYTPSRVFFSIFNGEMIDPVNNIIRRVCDNKNCLNPEHMIEQSMAEFMISSKTSAVYEKVNRITCPKGHFFDHQNTYTNPSKSESRECKTCKKDYMKEYRKNNADKLRELDRKRYRRLKTK